MPDDEVLQVDGRAVKVTNPGKVFFPDADGGPVTKLDLVRYWIEVADAALVGCAERPAILHRFPNGVADDGFYQKRLPKGAPDWVGSTTITFPSGRTAQMPVMADAAHLAWSATLGCLEVNPWPVRRADVDHPDELRIDLDPGAGRPVRLGPRRWPWWRARCSRARARGLPEDERQARDPRERPDRSRAGPSRRAGAPPSRSPARSSAGCPTSPLALVEGGAPRRVHRLQPERAGPDGRLGVQRAPDARRARVRRRSRGTRSRPWSPRPTRCARCRRGSGRSGDPGAAIADVEPRLARTAADPRRSPGRRRAWTTHRGRRTSRRARTSRHASRRHDVARACRSSRSPARRRRPRRSRASSDGRRSTRRRQDTSSRPTCSSTRCAGAAAHGRGSG